jgi:transcriptional regulator with XRE-family HTH domain
MSEELGKQINKLRTAKGLTAKQLAEAVKTSTNNIYRYESGNYTPTLKKLNEIAAALDCQVEILLTPRPAKKK